MDYKNIILPMLERVPDYKMPYIIGYIQGLIADEAMDDLFCLKLAERAAKDPDTESIPLEEAIKETEAGKDIHGHFQTVADLMEDLNKE